jgi:hypothetical protein
VPFDRPRGRVLQHEPGAELRRRPPDPVVRLPGGDVQVRAQAREPDLGQGIARAALRGARGDADPERCGEPDELEAGAIGCRIGRLRHGDRRGAQSAPGITHASFAELAEQVPPVDPRAQERQLQQEDARARDRSGPDPAHSAQDQAERSQHDERQPEREHPQ